MAFQEVTIAALVGSLGTLAIKELSSFFQLRKQQQYELLKITHEKKAAAAEKAIGFYSAYLSSLIELKASWKVFKRGIEHESSRISIEAVHEVLSKNGALMNSLITDHRRESFGVHLYFDLEVEAFWDSNDLENLSEYFAKLKFIDAEIQALLDLTSEEQEPKSRAEVAIDQKLSEYSEVLGQVIETLGKNEKALKEIVKRIREGFQSGFIIRQ